MKLCALSNQRWVSPPALHHPTYHPGYAGYVDPDGMAPGYANPSITQYYYEGQARAMVAFGKAWQEIAEFSAILLTLPVGGEVTVPARAAGVAAETGAIQQLVARGSGGALMALGRAGTGRETFRAIGSLEGESILAAAKALKDFGIKFKAKTEGGFIKFAGPGSKSQRLEIQVRPNGQVIRLEKIDKARTRRFDSAGRITQDHQSGEYLGGNFSGP